MGKFMMKMKLTGFEIEIQGDRGDAPRIANSIGQRLGAMIAPTTEMIGIEPVDARVSPQGALNLDAGVEGKPRKKRATRSARPASAGAVEAIAWNHDCERFGNPAQKWPTAKKAIWLLHVIGSSVEGRDAIDSAALISTFNMHFKEAGMIQLGNLNRDLAREKLKGIVGQNANVSPPTWHLTQAGKRAAGELVEAARSAAAGPKNGQSG